VTTKEVLRRAKENKVVYTGRVKKNWIVEVSGKKFRIEELFRDEKLCKRTLEGEELLLTSKVVDVPGVGRVKVVKCVMEDKKRTMLLGLSKLEEESRERNKRVSQEILD